MKDVFVSQKSEVDAADAVSIVFVQTYNRKLKNKMFRVKGCKILLVRLFYDTKRGG